MIDIQFIRDNPDLVTEKSKQKGVEIDVTSLLKLDEERKELLQTVEGLRQRRNEIAEQIKQAGGKPDQALIEEGRLLKIDLSKREEYLSETEEKWTTLLKKVPNMPTDDVPIGNSEADNVVVKTVGEIPKFDFEPKNHLELGEMRDWIDKERASKLSGARFVYLKGDLVSLQFAILRWVMDTVADQSLIEQLIKENNLSLKATPFTPVLPPMMMRTEAYEATGRLKAKEVTYKLTDDDLWLIGSAEHSLCAMYQNEVITAEELPIRYVGYSTSFRREAGTYGKDMVGIIRLHHFDKIEFEVFSDSKSSREEHDLLVVIQEYLVSQLNLPYRVVNKCTADIGDP
ncbi:MAG TPA: aminoacyl--tRNA ligase-related protein, partial [Patescibacteria group bacterium]|nr:aminoacyl--tRNA ligase-related protein [Patescibacteria group bacterium]